jgi:5-methylcytosine-specific restriction endonuclease McrA
VLLAAMSALVASAPTADTRGSAQEASSRQDVAILYQIIIYQCRECGAAEVVTSRGRRALSPREVETARCDARILEPGTPNRATIAPAIRAGVLARDEHRCQAPGCGSTHFLEVHHVVPRAEGGTNRAENLVTLCGRCHRFAHERPLLVRQWFGRNVATKENP